MSVLSLEVSVVSSSGNNVAAAELVVLSTDDEASETVFDLLLRASAAESAVVQHLIALEHTRVSRLKRHSDDSSSAELSADSLFVAKGSIHGSEGVPLPLYGKCAPLLRRHAWTRVYFEVSDALALKSARICEIDNEIPAMSGRWMAPSSAPSAAISAPGTLHFEGSALGIDCYKRFEARESLLTQMQQVTELASLLNIFASILIIFLSGVLYDELREFGLSIRFHFLQANLGGLDSVALIWALMLLCSFAFVLFVDCYKKRYVDSLGFGVCYALMLALFVSLPNQLMGRWQLGTASKCIVACETARLSLKIHAYVYETFRALSFAQLWRRSAEVPTAEEPTLDQSIAAQLRQDWVDSWQMSASFSATNGGSDGSPQPMAASSSGFAAYYAAANAPLNEQMLAFGAFLFFPCLVYRTNYPRTDDFVDWPKVASYFVKFWLCLLFVFVVFVRFCVPELEATATAPGSVFTLLTSLLNSSLPGASIVVIGFFSILHFWINMWTELTCFADKKCYDNWWNAKTWASFYRKWNSLVSDWLHNYLILPLLEAGYARSSAEVCSLLLSALAYEYLLSMCLGFVYPIFLVSVSLICTFVPVPPTNTHKKSQVWTLQLWLVLLLQNGTCLVLYGREYYAHRAHETGTVHFDTQSWLPYSWQALLEANQ